jgi:hypothetical protein
MTKQPSAIVRIPTPHKGGQEIFLNWSVDNPMAQCLVAPCGTKVGKSFASSMWILTEALSNQKFYCAYIAPTYQKCRIAYRYIKAMLPNHPFFKPIDGRLEIEFANGSFIKFMHGRDAEVTVEGEAIDRFVIDEAGKITKQVWLSLLTTITQTRGKGIITGTPRGFSWYHDVYKQAKNEKPKKTKPKFFVHTTLKTENSPYVTAEAIEIAQSLLPKHLFQQYYEAKFITHGAVFGDLDRIWTDEPFRNNAFWIDEVEKNRRQPVIHGVDIAKQNDWTVFYSVNFAGKLVGFVRFRHIAYTQQIMRLKTYLIKYFGVDDFVRFDATGVGVAFGDMLEEAEIPASIEPVIFTNKSKGEMVTKLCMAIESGWHKAPQIPVIEQEFGAYEVEITKTGMCRYQAVEGNHDDIVSAAMLSISEAYGQAQTDRALESLTNDDVEDNYIAAYAAAAADLQDDFFDNDAQDFADIDIDLDNM